MFIQVTAKDDNHRMIVNKEKIEFIDENPETGEVTLYIDTDNKSKALVVKEQLNYFIFNIL